MNNPVIPAAESTPRLNFGFAWGTLYSAIDYPRLHSEGASLGWPNENGYPLINGKRVIDGLIDGELGSRQGKAIAVVVGDEEHFHNLPPRPKVRMHSACSFSEITEEIAAAVLSRSDQQLDFGEYDALELTYDLLNKDFTPRRDCDCRAQGRIGLKDIIEEGGVFLDLMYQDGRGHGLLKKLAIANLQRQGLTTAEACFKLGLEWDVRDYSHIAKFLLTRGLTDITLLTDNQRKHEALQTAGITTAQEKRPAEPSGCLPRLS